MSVHELRPPGPPPWWQDVLDELVVVKVLGLDELAGRLDVDMRELEDALAASPLTHEGDDGWMHLLTLCEGAVFTRVVTEPELAAGVLHVDHDLLLWGRLAADEGLPIRGGGRLRTVWESKDFPGEPVLAGPGGWLDGFKPGDLIAVRLRGGIFEISTVSLDAMSSRDDSEALTHVVQTCFEQAMSWLCFFAEVAAEDPNELLGMPPGTPLDDVVANILAERPETFAEPLPPVGMILTKAGLELAGGYVALAGAPWDPADVEDLGPEDIVGFTLVRGGLRLSDEHSDLSGLLANLTRSEAVLLRIADEVEKEPLEAEFLAALRRAASGSAQTAAAVLLAARSAEGEGRAAEASELVEQALMIVPELLPALADAAEYAACRGDVVRADNLLRRMGLGAGDHLRSSLRPLLQAPAGVVGRNRPCPCGSGRKYKQCCLRKQAHPLPERATLLYHLLLTYAHRAANRGLIKHLVDMCAPELEPCLADLVLFEYDIIDDFIEDRGRWLREDERSLLASWRETPLRLWEVVSTRPEHREAVVRPLPGGEPVVLRDKLFSQHARRLDLMLARLLDDGTGPHIFGSPFRVDRLRRPQMLALLADRVDPVVIAEFFGPQQAPRLSNREGHELVQCSATYEADPAGWEALAASPGLKEEGADRLVAVRDDGVIRGSLRRDGSRWKVETNSLERLRELQELVRSAVPGARQVTESTVPMDKLMNELTESGLPTPRAPVTATSGALDRVLEEFIRQQEQKWVDESIPALGGLTPRQAMAQGGAALEELNTLLDDFDWAAHGPVDMSGQRIRHLLGLG